LMDSFLTPRFKIGKCHICHVTVMMRPIVETLSTFGAEPFRPRDLVDRLGYASGYARNFLSQARRQELIIVEQNKVKKEKKFRLNPNVVREVVMKGGREKEELLDALGLHTKYRGQYVALKGFKVVDHDPDLQRLGDRVFPHIDAPDGIVITNVGRPKKFIAIEI